MTQIITTITREYVLLASDSAYISQRPQAGPTSGRRYVQTGEPLKYLRNWLHGPRANIGHPDSRMDRQDSRCRTMLGLSKRKSHIVRTRQSRAVECAPTSPPPGICDRGLGSLHKFDRPQVTRVCHYEHEGRDWANTLHRTSRKFCGSTPRITGWGGSVDLRHRAAFAVRTNETIGAKPAEPRQKGNVAKSGTETARR